MKLCGEPEGLPLMGRPFLRRTVTLSGKAAKGSSQAESKMLGVRADCDAAKGLKIRHGATAPSNEPIVVNFLYKTVVS